MSGFSPEDVFVMKIPWLLIVSFLIPGNLYGQELEARAYSNLPKDMNAIALVYAYSKGSVIADASLPIEDFEISAHNIGLRYVRTFGVWEKLGRVNISLPFVHMAGQLKVSGQDTSAERTGLGDMRVQMGVNLIGSPALDKKDFTKYQQKTVVGVTLAASVPTGLYYEDKRVNIGTHRWGFKPEIGASKRFKRIYIDGYVGVWFYTNNSTYLVTKELKQEPLLSTQFHASYYFKNGAMVGVNGNWYRGGQTSVDHAPQGNPVNHWRAGATCAIPFTGKQLIKLQYHTTVDVNTGTRFYLLAIGYQYVFF